MDPTLISSGAQLLSGLGGLFSKKKRKTQIQQTSEKVSLAQLKQQQSLIPRQTQLISQAMSDAAMYDPAKENAKLKASLESSGARQAELGQKAILGQVARGGGVLGGDTNILRLRQRNLDSATSPVMMQLANLESQQAAQKQAMLRNAAAMGNGGNFANQVAFSSLNSPQDNQSAGAFQNLAEGIDGLGRAKANAKNKKGANAAKQAASLWARFGVR